MKKLVSLLLLLALLPCGCAARASDAAGTSPAPGAFSPTPSVRPVEWEILRTPEPTPIPTPAPDNADECGFFEIDIDTTDGYRDFVMEHRYSDVYYGTRFYRLIDGAYVELGYLDGVATGKLSQSRVPNIIVDGSGVIYAIERSKIATWARIARAYRVEGGVLVRIPTENVVDGGALERIKDAPVFFVTEPVTVYDMLEERERTLEVGEYVSFEYSDEVGALYAPYFPPGSNELRYIMLELDECDCIRNGPFFGNCFYSEYVEWIG
ncbi:MAG TPA: hypothetical protein PK438_05910 [Clostridia bacterium]|nr:MAG: hypothetical protein BWY35_01559 [Firmicutes bacterium ADurb.Bin248]HOG00673.1 hypothetical protein [Clostridia bacterium]HOS18804.1 hypothetical protein [Clostridia bacterium]HPK15445.1 hypothetical protein [Clostridia bacterium]